MLRFFERDNYCNIVIDPLLTSEDSIRLEALFGRDYDGWHVEFGRIYSIDEDIIKVLYQEIIENRKNISISTHKHRLNRYFHQLGFKTIFKSLIKESIVEVSMVEVVLIGGSADSSSKIIDIVKNSKLEHLTVVIVQHVEPHKDGNFDKILQQYTTQRVSYAKDREQVKKGTIYLAPNNRHLKISNGYFVLSDEEPYNYSRPSISVSYESFSSYYKDALLVIQECGYASDGVDKLKLLKQNRSKIVLQEISECEAKPMVENALRVGVEDYILNTKDIIIYINILDQKLNYEEWIEYLLVAIFKKYGYDFRLYQRVMIKRRLDIFMLKHGLADMKETVAIILFDKRAFKGLFLEISINVTEFFRNTKSFLITIGFLNKFYKNRHNIRVWSAGCSSGEEVYSMAIILDSLGLLDKSIIYATDFNRVVLDEAKNGIYSNNSYKTAKENFSKLGIGNSLGKYMKKNKHFIIINEDIKEKTLFFQHNLATDSSFNEFDIIICKNVMIYFDENLQLKVFKLFYNSLKFGGHLILGESEQIHILFANKFKRCDKNCKIFQKVD